MKLPSIKQNKYPDKPNSATIQRQPINISSLEKNLLRKLNQYDEAHDIKNSESLKLSSSHFNTDTIDKFIKDEPSPPPMVEIRSKNKKITFQQNTEDIEAKPRFSNDQKKLKPILQNRQEQPIPQSQPQVFLTGTEQKIVDRESDSDNSNKEIAKINKRQKERDQIRKAINFSEDEEFNNIHQLLHRNNQAQSELNEQFSEIGGLKKTIHSLNQTYSTYGLGINQDLMDKFEDQFQAILQMQREDDVSYRIYTNYKALDEYFLEQETKPKKGQKKQQVRATSLAGKKKRKAQIKKESDSEG